MKQLNKRMLQLQNILRSRHNTIWNWGWKTIFSPGCARKIQE